MKTAIGMLSCTLLLALSACSNENQVTNDDHVFKAQTDALEKARGVEQMLHDADAKKRLELEQQSQ